MSVCRSSSPVGYPSGDLNQGAAHYGLATSSGGRRGFADVGALLSPLATATGVKIGTVYLSGSSPLTHSLLHGSLLVVVCSIAVLFWAGRVAVIVSA